MDTDIKYVSFYTVQSMKFLYVDGYEISITYSDYKHWHNIKVNLNKELTDFIKKYNFQVFKNISEYGCNKSFVYDNNKDEYGEIAIDVEYGYKDDEYLVECWPKDINLIGRIVEFIKIRKLKLNDDEINMIRETDYGRYLLNKKKNKLIKRNGHFDIIIKTC